MTESVQQTSNGSRCRGTNRHGERRQRLASEPGGLCIVHAGKQSMAELGRKGGSRSPLTKLRREADDELREKAKAALVDALDGDDEKRRFEAAKSLYSFRAAAPPVGAQAREPTGGKVIGVADVVRVAVECGLIRAADGGPVLVDGERVVRNDPRTPSRTESQNRPTPNVSPHANNKPPEQLSDLVDADAPDFDESEAAKLTRRFGNDEGNYRW